jgi:hypothetical protein
VTLHNFFKATMKISWTNLKISIAGARLSHLVQKDKVWDHGSIVEQVRTVFIYLKKAFIQKDPTIVKKCMTPEIYKKIRKEIESKKWKTIIEAELVSVEIISVIPSKYDQPDKFKALIKLKKAGKENLIGAISFYRSNRLSEQEWLFVREGNWWLLDEIRR